MPRYSNSDRMQRPDCEVDIEWDAKTKLTLRYAREGQWDSHVDQISLTAYDQHRLTQRDEFIKRRLTIHSRVNLNFVNRNRSLAEHHDG